MRKKKTLGASIIIPANAEVFERGVGASEKWFVPSIEILIGIGKDHTAKITMDKEAWAALKKGEKVHISEGVTAK
jgi:hypothetical protein